MSLEVGNSKFAKKMPIKPFFTLLPQSVFRIAEVVKRDLSSERTATPPPEDEIKIAFY